METFMTVFLSASVMVWGLLCFVWEKKDWFNFVLKILLATMWVSSLILLLVHLGVLVKG